MGYWKRILEEIESRGAQFIDDTFVCEGCVHDEALKAVVAENAASDICSFCGESRPSAEMDVLMEAIIDGLRYEYDDPNNELGWVDGEWVGTTIDKYDLISDLEIAEDGKLRDAIIDAVNNFEWCRKNPYGLSRHERLAYGWQNFCNLVKHSSRFFFWQRRARQGIYRDPDEVTPREMLTELAKVIKNLDLIRPLPRGTRVFRARHHADGVTYQTPEDLGPPDEKTAGINRMSGAGIVAFYGALEPETALSEVNYPEADDAATVVGFDTLETFRVVDLTKLPRVPSLFDTGLRHLRGSIKFIHDFMVDFARPISTPDAPIDYVPTQIVTEYIRDVMRLKVRGIIYPSAKHPGGKSCVLFFNREECRPNGEGYPPPTQYLRMAPDSIERHASKSALVSTGASRQPVKRV